MNAQELVEAIEKRKIPQARKMAPRKRTLKSGTLAARRDGNLMPRMPKCFTISSDP
jgi:hypothetical protein